MSSNYFSLHAESAKRAAGYFFKQPIASLLILAMLSIAMTLPLTLYLGVQSSKDVLDKLNDVPNITLYMDASANPVHNETVQKLLAEDKRVQAVKFVGKEQGLAEMQQAMGRKKTIRKRLRHCKKICRIIRWWNRRKWTRNGCKPCINSTSW